MWSEEERKFKWKEKIEKEQSGKEYLHFTNVVSGEWFDST
jgi:hypothetical protein